MKWAGLLAIMLLSMELVYGCSQTSKGPIHHHGAGHDSGSKW
jgi:hypothetical protein